MTGQISRFLVYGLADPRSKAHLRPSTLAAEAKTHKSRWLRTLRADGMRAEVIVLEQISDESLLDDAECFWIAQAKGLGWDLTNLTKGGEGMRGHQWSAESRAKASATRAGRKREPFSPEWRAKIAATLRGRKLSPEHVAAATAGRIGKKRDPYKVNNTPESTARRSTALKAFYERKRAAARRPHQEEFPWASGTR